MSVPASTRPAENPRISMAVIALGIKELLVDCMSLMIDLLEFAIKGHKFPSVSANIKYAEIEYPFIKYIKMLEHKHAKS